MALSSRILGNETGILKNPTSTKTDQGEQKKEGLGIAFLIMTSGKKMCGIEEELLAA